MTFELTEEFVNAIISAMDNQTCSFAVNAQDASLVEISDAIRVDDDKFYSLPEWGSADGFAMREDFLKQLHAPLVKEKLQQVMHSGRGLFKNFREVLKDYPEIDKRWHIFKFRYMSARINEWYNSLREIWGLEKLNQFTETDEDLVCNDFSFREYVSSDDKKSILFNITPDIFDDDNLTETAKNALCCLYKNQFEYADSFGQTGFTCRSVSDDFAGCITASSFVKNQEEILVISSLFVPEEFRGLGICTELLERFVSKIQSTASKGILIPQNFVPEILEPLLIRTGFVKTLSGYYLS